MGAQSRHRPAHNLKEHLDADEQTERQTWLDTCLGQFNDAKEPD
ncbi:hypothetical protein [Pyxidicoccus sp. MSG2]|nr:hypothetical protein [Pyxidicoccus sp. MSG2]MCY1023927.1 hypothetical protein [Pyxidicoccus sp. MSG2]